MRWFEYDGNNENRRPPRVDEYVVWLDYGYWLILLFDGDGFGEEIDGHVTHYMIPSQPGRAGPDLRAALEAIAREGDPATATRDWPTPEEFADWAIEQAQAALEELEEKEG